jgi:hypothetical protein
MNGVSGRRLTWRRLAWLAVPVLGGALLVAAGTPAMAQSSISARPAATAVRVSPGRWEAGQVTVGQQTTVTLTLTNVGTTTVSIGNVSVSEDRDFGGGGGQCQGAVVRPGRSCTSSVWFAPTGFGDRTATLYFMDSSQVVTLASVPLHGWAVPFTFVPAASWNFGRIAVGLEALQDIQLTNITPDVLNLGNVNTTPDSSTDLAVDPGDCVFTTLNPGDSCTMYLIFEPTLPPGRTSAVRTATVTIPDADTGVTMFNFPFRGTATR